MASTPQSDVAQAISNLHRTEGGLIVAILIRLELVTNDSERCFLERRLREVQPEHLHIQLN